MALSMNGQFRSRPDVYPGHARPVIVCKSQYCVFIFPSLQPAQSSGENHRDPQVPACEGRSSPPCLDLSVVLPLLRALHSLPVFHTPPAAPLQPSFLSVLRGSFCRDFSRVGLRSHEQHSDASSQTLVCVT